MGKRILDKNASSQIHIQKMKFEELGQEGRIDCWSDLEKYVPIR